MTNADSGFAPLADAWRVLVIGGASGTGKTTLAAALARRFSTSHMQLDDVRLALQRVTTPAQQPALHHFAANDDVLWLRPDAVRLRGMIGVAALMSEALQPLVEYHVQVKSAGRLIIEGDGLAPAFARAAIDRYASGQVQALVLSEPDEAATYTSMERRDVGFSRRTPAVHRAQARTAHLFDRWLRAEAGSSTLPVLLSRPWETLLARAIAALSANP